MPHSSNLAISTFVALDRSADPPLFRQLARSLQKAISGGTLSAGTKLPSTRTLADDLDVSRNTVRQAYNQLQSEGFLEGQVGAGTYVSSRLPDYYTQSVKGTKRTVPPSLRVTSAEERTPSVSKRSRRISDLPLPRLEHPCTEMAFRPGLPALDAFPIETWATLTSRRWRSMPPERLVYGNPRGFKPLRNTIAKHLRHARGVRCSAEQVLIASGTQQAITLAARTLLDFGDEAWIEDPGYPPMREGFAAVGARPRPVPVDKEGLNISALAEGKSPEGVPSKKASPHLVGVTPSHQFPLGVTMSLDRRLKLLEWAAETRTWIFEDDYDSEYRYSGRPVAALQGLDNTERVIYAGSFSKVLFPALRLGYLVVPPDLVEVFTKMRSLADRCPPRMQQMVLTDFIEEGHFERHIREMRTLYASRQAVLREEIEERLSDMIEIEANDAGLHLVAWLPEEVSDRAVSDRLEEFDIIAPPLSFYCKENSEKGGLLLGYGAVSEEEISEGVARMAKALEPFRKK